MYKEGGGGRLSARLGALVGFLPELVRKYESSMNKNIW